MAMKGLRSRFWPLYVVTFVSGAAVLAIEILGTRILGPFYGVTLFLWSALISVTLSALALGYAVGGRVADKVGTLRTLGMLLGGAGLWLLLLPWIKHPLLSMLEPAGLRLAVLFGATVLFALPLTLLGMVSPVAIRVRAQKLNEVGRSAGDLYAISTAGGVLAAIAVGFVLIPSVGVNRLTLLVGVFLLMGAGVALVADSKTRRRAASALPIVLIWGAALASMASDTVERRSLLVVEQSHYGELRVLDYDDGSRHMLIDGGVHSSVLAGSWQSLQPYIWVTDVSKRLFAQPGKMLLIGLGAGSTAMSFASDGWSVDVVEIDPVVTKLAIRYFGLSAGGIDIAHDDGRRFLRTAAERYDCIVLDAFSSNSIPFHLFTSESFALAAGRLEPGGVFVMNIESVGWRTPLVQAVAATLAEHFKNVLALPVNEDASQLTNIIMLASDRPFDLGLPLSGETHEDEAREHAWANRFRPEPGVVLTDDLTPVDVWSESLNAQSRAALHAGFRAGGREGVNW